ncbi:MAG: hypothetical protein WBL55_24455, partial [Xanthobacteraceae bacterium]
MDYLLCRLTAVMPGNSRSKNGVVSLVYRRASTSLETLGSKDVDGRDKPGHDVNVLAVNTIHFGTRRGAFVLGRRLCRR